MKAIRLMCGCIVIAVLSSCAINRPKLTPEEVGNYQSIDELVTKKLGYQFDAYFNGTNYRAVSKSLSYATDYCVHNGGTLVQTANYIDLEVLPS